MRKPFFRTQTNCWYVKDEDGRFIRLGEKKTEAFTQWKAMLTDENLVKDEITLFRLCDEFLNEHEKLLSESRLKDCQRVTQSLINFSGSRLKAANGTPGKVTAWLRTAKPGQLKKDGTRGREKVWSGSRQKDAASWIVRIYRWGVNTDRLSKSPLEGMKMPKAGHREGVISPDAHQKMMAEVMQSRSKSFACYLIASHCGARPQQIREITADHCSDGFMTASFSQHKTAEATGKPLVVYFSPCLQTLLKILAAKRPKGRLFLNDQRRPWQKDTVCQRFARLRRKLGLPDDAVVYLYRHTFATDSLRAGQSEAVTAALLGHTSSEMVRRIYGHLKQHDKELIEAAAQAARKRMGG